MYSSEPSQDSSNIGTQDLKEDDNNNRLEPPGFLKYAIKENYLLTHHRRIHGHCTITQHKQYGQ